MKNYEYRTTLTPQEQANPILAAAFAVAVNAHKKQMRGKLNDVPYITHPLMVLDILYAMGVTDPIMQAAAILHDTLEDFEEYAGPKKSRKHYYYRMKEDLQRELRQRIGERMNPFDERDQRVMTRMLADDIADQTYHLVKEVTKPKIYDEGMKLIAQIEHMKHASLKAKILKIADQGGSLLCRLHKPENLKVITKQKQREFTSKSTNLVQAILESARNDSEAMAMQPWDRAFFWISYFARELDRKETHKEEKAIRRDLDFKSFFAPQALNKNTSVQVDESKISGHFYCDAFERKRQLPLRGTVLRRVDFDKQGNVVSCVLTTGTGENHPGNKLRDAWITAIAKVDEQRGEPWRDIKIEDIVPVHPEKIEEGRLFRLMRPMQVEAFAVACMDSICTPDYVSAIVANSEQVAGKRRTLGLEDAWLALEQPKSWQKTEEARRAGNLWRRGLD